MTKVSRLATLGLLALSAAAHAQVPATARAGATKPDCAAMNAADHATMDHSKHDMMMDACAGPLPTLPGQAAFGAIAEVVALLKADPATDWSKVNLEALRQHLIDMDQVVMRSVVVQRPVPGGIEMKVTGTGSTVAAIRRMAMSHTNALSEGDDYRASATEIANGARLTVVAKDSSNAKLVAMIRGLGFAGLMTEGDHHVRHHLALARGEAHPHKM